MMPNSIFSVLAGGSCLCGLCAARMPPVTSANFRNPLLSSSGIT
jgi:hypothetical protein